MSINQNQYPRILSALRRTQIQFPELLARDYARILMRIELLWGTKQATDYFDSVFLGDNSNRSNRQGFPIEVMNEIVQLKQVHEFLYPTLELNPYDPFSGYTLPAPANIEYKRAAEKTVPPRPAAPPNSPTTPSLAITPSLATTPSSATIPRSATPAPEKKLGPQIDWPYLNTQRGLIEQVKLLHGGKHIYEQQGKQIGEILMHYRLIDEKTLHAVRQTQQEPSHKDKAFGQILSKVGLVNRDELVQALCIQTGVIMVDILNIPITFETLRLIPSDKAREKQAIPVLLYEGALFLAVADPIAFNDYFHFTRLSSHKIIPIFALRHNIVNRLNSYN